MRALRGVLAMRTLRALLIGAAALLPASTVTAVAAGPAAAQTQTASVSVNATAGLGTVPAHAIGLSTAVYNAHMNDTAIPPLLKAAGIDALRYPGGSYSDIYNWQNQTAVAGGYVAPDTSFSDFMSTAHSAGAAPIITVNYGTGTPSLAAAWVQAAASDNVQYWEVGNEVYGNGTYGADWEADAHCNTSLNGSPVTIGSEPSQTYNCGPVQYAANFLRFQSAIHAVDANAKVCAVLTTPGFWPDGVTNSEYPQAWNQTVLSALGASTQCVIVHYYPGGSSTASMLTGVTIPGAPGQPTVSGLSSSTSSNTSGTATITWPAATAGTYPVAQYHVYSSSGTLVTSTTGTSVTLTGLTIGDSYTYDVVAVDTQGNASLPSPPVTFTVPPPANASCAVHYALTSSWQGGFQVSVTITNNASSAVSGWNLTWTWPTSGETITQLWNGSHTQSGTAVTVTNASYNGTIAASGGTASFGFLGSDTGQTTAPAAFYLNGNICSND
jgi:hypothetical protein